MARSYTIREEHGSRHPTPPAGTGSGGRTLLRVGDVVVLALVAGAVAWFVLQDDNTSSSPVGPTDGPTAVV